MIFFLNDGGAATESTTISPRVVFGALIQKIDFLIFHPVKRIEFLRRKERGMTTIRIGRLLLMFKIGLMALGTRLCRQCEHR